MGGGIGASVLIAAPVQFQGVSGMLWHKREPRPAGCLEQAVSARMVHSAAPTDSLPPTSSSAASVAFALRMDGAASAEPY